MKTERMARQYAAALGDLLLIAVYCAGIVGANAVVTLYGQAALPFTAVVLIPMDLVVRDLLQDRWSVKSPWKLRLFMLALIVGGSALAFITTVASIRIAAASATAFCLTGILDAVTYQAMLRKGRMFRINLATILAAVTDTLIFAYMAFDDVEPLLCVYQVASKIIGGVMWSLLLLPLFRDRRQKAETDNRCIQLTRKEWEDFDALINRATHVALERWAILDGRPIWIDSLPKYRGGP